MKKISPPTTMKLITKIAAVWGLENFEVVLMGKGLHHVILQTIEDQSGVMSHGPVNVLSGIFRVARWTPGFDWASLKMTTQIWV